MVAKWFCIALFATTAQSPLGCTTLAVGIQRLTLHFFLSGDHSVLPLIGVVKMKNDNAFADISRKPSSHYEFLKSICAFDVCYFVVHCPFWWFVLVQIWSVSAVNTTITHLKKRPNTNTSIKQGPPRLSPPKHSTTKDSHNHLPHKSREAGRKLTPQCNTHHKAAFSQAPCSKAQPLGMSDRQFIGGEWELEFTCGPAMDQGPCKHTDWII